VSYLGSFVPLFCLFSHVHTYISMYSRSPPSVSNVLLLVL
jgi:hypothetical protein